MGSDNRAVFFDDAAQVIQWQRRDGAFLPADHGLGGGEGIEDGFFDSLGGRLEEGVEMVVREHFEVERGVGGNGQVVAGGEGEEDVSAPVEADAADARKAKGGAFGKPGTLAGNERSVGGNNDDDRTALRGIASLLKILLRGQYPPDRNAIDAQEIAFAVVSLDEHAHGIVSIAGGDDARGGADSTFELVADHARPAPDIPFCDATALRRSQRVIGMLLRDGEAIDVV